MRTLKPLVLIAALVVAPAAHADQICDAVRNAIAIGSADRNFAALAVKTPAPKGFVCKVTIEASRGYYACEARVTPPEGVARANAVIESVKQCIGADPTLESSPNGATAMFEVPNQPSLRVIVDGADYATRVYLNVVAS